MRLPPSSSKWPETDRLDAGLARSPIVGFLIALALLSFGSYWHGAAAAELDYPQVIRVRYEAKDPRVGGYLIVWVEREKIFYGLDSKLYPAARYVEVTHVTPAPGSITLTFIEVAPINSSVPEFFHLSGNVRFRVSGMEVAWTNIPAIPRTPNVPGRQP
jgi:hypothetical protein